MNRTFIRLSLGVLIQALVSTAFVPVQRPKKEARYTINGVFCSGCVGGLKAVAKKIDGVDEVTVDVEERLVVVTFDAEKTTEEAIREYINAERPSIYHSRKSMISRGFPVPFWDGFPAARSRSSIFQRL